MMKKVLIALFLLAMSVLGSKAFIGLFAYQSIEKLKLLTQQQAAISYGWISSDFAGTLVFHDLVITPFKLKRSFHIKRAELQFDGFANLLMELPKLKEGDGRGLRRLAFYPITAPFEGRDLDSWLAAEYGDFYSVALGTYACGAHTRLTFDDFRNMGINELEGSLDLKLDANPDRTQLRLTVIAEVNDLGKTELETLWSTERLPNLVSQLERSHLVLKSLTLTHNEGGYFRRLSNYCANASGQERDVFSRRAAELWRQTMALKGLELGREFETLYRDYLLLGGQLKIGLYPAKPVAMAELSSLVDQDLIERLGFRAELSGSAVPISGLRLRADYFRALQPEVVVTNTNKKPLVQRPIVREKTFVPIALEDLRENIGQKLRLRFYEGKVFIGNLVAVREQALDISQLVGGGEVTYSFRLDQIAQVEVWR